jgi:hypothetical protein
LRDHFDDNAILDTDQASAALVMDLKQRGLLDETLVIWGGEFGRGVAGQGKWDSPEGGRDQFGSRVAAQDQAGSTGPPTISATMSQSRRSTFGICTPQCSTSWASTTSDLRTAT